MFSDRSSFHWTSGFNEDGVPRTTSSSSSSAAASSASASGGGGAGGSGSGGGVGGGGPGGSGASQASSASPTQLLFAADPWSACLLAFLQPDRLLAQCPSAVHQAWPTAHTRLTQLFAVVDPS